MKRALICAVVLTALTSHLYAGELTGPDDSELLPAGVPRVFKAHLIGFDGIGNDIGDPYKGEDFFEPSVILRMADGSKRCFQSKTFCQADREFILDAYVKEMKRITGTLDQTEYGIRPRTREEYPGGTPIGQPGSLLLKSAHFVVPSGSQAPGGDNDRWLNDKQPEVAARLRECVFNMFEHMHAYLLRHTDHPNLLSYGRNRGELDEVARQLDSARRSLQEEERSTGASEGDGE